MRIFLRHLISGFNLFPVSLHSSETRELVTTGAEFVSELLINSLSAAILIFFAMEEVKVVIEAWKNKNSSCSSPSDCVGCCRNRTSLGSGSKKPGLKIRLV